MITNYQFAILFTQYCSTFSDILKKSVRINVITKCVLCVYVYVRLSN